MNWKLWSEAREIAGRHARGDGDDLAQDLIVAALERGAAAENPGAWLERVGRNAAIDRWRVQRRRDELATRDRSAGGADRSGGGSALSRAAGAGAAGAGGVAAAAAAGGAGAVSRGAAVRGGGGAGRGAGDHRPHACPPRARQPAGAAGSAARDVRFSGRADERARAGVRGGRRARADAGAGAVARRDLASAAPRRRASLCPHAGDGRSVAGCRPPRPNGRPHPGLSSRRHPRRTPRLRRSGWCSARTSSKEASSGPTERSSG